MAKNSIRDYSATNSANTDIQSIDISEGCSPAGINNAIREVMADLKDVSTGAVALESPAMDSLTVDTTGIVYSGGNVGIGTSSPSSFYSLADNIVVGTGSGGNGMTIYSGSADSGYIGFNDTASASMQGYIQYNHNGDYMAFAPNGTEKMRIDSSGNVGIGVTPFANNIGKGLDIDSGAGMFGSSNSNYLTANLYYSSGWKYKASAGGSMALLDGAGSIQFFNAPAGSANGSATLTERMRIDSSGNLLVGKTTTALNTNGIRFVGNDTSNMTVSGGTVLDLNRRTSDGSILGFYRGGTTVGSIGNRDADDIFINTAGGTGSLSVGGTEYYAWSSGAIYPWTDNARDLGAASLRWDDIYATNGTIQTSDANEKQQIATLTDAEMTAAKAISALFKTFKWNSAVTEKGDAARTHTGVIAQDVQAAMTAAGLDAGDYAFFISTTWWETQTEVPAVEALDAVLDEDGNVVTEAIEAVAAYTRTDTYDTAEEAPEGATERNRKGIRYPELMAFVGAATEQRLNNIETRLAALEAN